MNLNAEEQTDIKFNRSCLFPKKQKRYPKGLRPFTPYVLRVTEDIEDVHSDAIIITSNELK